MDPSSPWASSPPAPEQPALASPQATPQRQQQQQHQTHVYVRVHANPPAAASALSSFPAAPAAAATDDDESSARSDPPQAALPALQQRPPQRASQGDLFHNAWTYAAAAPASLASFFGGGNTTVGRPTATPDLPDAGTEPSLSQSSTWSTLLRRFSTRASAPPLSTGELPGAEAVSAIDGRLIGPRRENTLNDYESYSTILSVALCMWIFVGIVLIATLFVAVTINVAYAAFHAAENLLVWPLLLGLAFYVELGYVMALSLMRTGMRLMRFFWNAHYGRKEDANIFPVNLCDTAILRLVINLDKLAKQTLARLNWLPASAVSNSNNEEERHLLSNAIADAVQEASAEIAASVEPSASGAAPATGLSDPRAGLTEEEIETYEERADKVGLMVYGAFLFVVVGLPLTFITVVFPFWTVLSIFAIGFVASSMACIIGVNLLARVRRSYVVLDELWDDNNRVTDAQLRATYYASAGFDTGVDLLETIVDRGLKGTIAVLVFSLLFTGYSADHSLMYFSGLILVLLLACKLKTVKKYVFRIEAKTFFQAESAGGLDDDEVDYALYNGALEWPAWVVFGIRCAMWVIGFSSLLYYDLEWKRRDATESDLTIGSPFKVGVHRIGLFVVFVILYDLALLLPIVRHRTHENQFWYFIGRAKSRVLLIGSLMGCVIASALYSRLLYPGFSSSVAVVISVLLLSFRHPRCRWTNYQKTFVRTAFGKEARLERRGASNAAITIAMTAGFVAASFVAALAIGILRNTPPSMPDPVEDSATAAALWRGGFVPRVPVIGVPAGYSPARRDLWKRELREMSVDGKTTEEYGAFSIDTSNARKQSPMICKLQVLSPHNASAAAGGVVPKPLTVLDFAALARGSYEASAAAAEHQVHVYGRSGLEDWHVVNSTLGRSLGVQWVEYRYNGTLAGPDETDYGSVSVVAVRGTSDLNDALQDLYLWSTSALLQTSTYMGTLVNTWPAESVDRLASFIMAFGPLDSTLVYWAEVEAHVRHLLEQQPHGRRVLMTGHSLGGAIAAIVGAHASVPAASFSAPGLGYSTRRYALELEALQRFALNVVPWHDVVPTFDLQVGLVQAIPCAEAEFLSCHSLDLSIDTLFEQCAT
ncbi:hypothetical protein HK405_008586 [Cladochytrium tenue]|nr:hypothetical protein HK405_008586 [Cladochytrium tenue]